jgi:predicted O-methyltransferase YrrM
MKKISVILVAAVATTLAVAMTLAQGPGGPPDEPRGSQRGGRFQPPPSPLVEVLDANHDGEISAEEVQNASEALRKLDKNQDGKLTLAELRPQWPREGERRGQRRPEGDAPDGPPPSEPAAGDRAGPRGWAMGGVPFQSEPLGKNDAEKKLLGVLDEMLDQREPGGMSVPRDDGRLLRLLVESIGAKNVVEVGTSVGYSSVWFSVGIRATGGRLTTFEIDKERAACARKNFEKAGVTDLVTLVEGDAHDEVKKLKDPIDLVFLDADKEGYLDYLTTLLPLVRPGGLVVAHNMNRHQADPRYVKAVTTNPDLETVFVNVGGSSIGLTLKKR